METIKPKALVIDDDKLFRIVHSKMLGKLGYDVMLACNGKEGLEAIKTNNFDIVLTWDQTYPKYYMYNFPYTECLDKIEQKLQLDKVKLIYNMLFYD